MMTAMKYGYGFLESAGYNLAFQAHGWSIEVYGCAPEPGHEAIFWELLWQSGLEVPGGRETLRHMPQTDALAGLNQSSLATAASSSTVVSSRVRVLQTQ